MSETNASVGDYPLIKIDPSPHPLSIQTEQPNNRTTEQPNNRTTMLHFNFQRNDKNSTNHTNNSFRLPDPHDPIYNLELQIDRIKDLPPTKRLALLYNDAKNYEMSKTQPFEAWYQKRIQILQEYAALDWLALGEHLSQTGQTEQALRSNCQTIHDGLQQLLSDFNLSLFCHTLSNIDHLWSILFPRHLKGVEDPTVKALLVYFGVQVE